MYSFSYISDMRFYDNFYIYFLIIINLNQLSSDLSKTHITTLFLNFSFQKKKKKNFEYKLWGHVQTDIPAYQMGVNSTFVVEHILWYNQQQIFASSFLEQNTQHNTKPNKNMKTLRSWILSQTRKHMSFCSDTKKKA